MSTSETFCAPSSISRTNDSANRSRSASYREWWAGRVNRLRRLLSEPRGQPAATDLSHFVSLPLAKKLDSVRGDHEVQKIQLRVEIYCGDCGLRIASELAARVSVIVHRAVSFLAWLRDADIKS
jgi:hypothetical protein